MKLFSSSVLSGQTRAILAACLLLPFSPVFGQWAVSAGGNDGPNTPHAAPTPPPPPAPRFNPVNSVIQSNNATSAAVRSNIQQIGSVFQQEYGSGNADQPSSYSDDSTSSGNGSDGGGNTSSDSASNNPGNNNNNNNNNPAPSQAPPPPPSASDRALQAAALTAAERERYQNFLNSEVQNTLDAPAGSAAQDADYSQGAQPANFPDVADQYTSSQGGGTAPASNFLDRTRGGSDQATPLDDGVGDTTDDLTFAYQPRGGWLRTLYTRWVNRVANADLPQPLPPADDPDLPLDPIDIIRTHPVFSVPYIKPFMDPVLDSAKRHYHYNISQGKSDGL